MSRSQLFLLLSFAAISIIFYAYPEIDLNVSAYFFDPHKGFMSDELWLIIGAKMPNLLIPGTVISVLIWGYLRFREKGRFSLYEFNDIVFFSLATLFSALLLVWCFKLGFSRIRPRFIEEFNGFELFTRAYQVNPTSTRDVSFISGHAATGFMYMALAFLYEGRTRIMLMSSSLFLGGFIGFTRLASGNHFLSDIVVAGFVVYFGTFFIYKICEAKVGLGQSRRSDQNHIQA